MNIDNLVRFSPEPKYRGIHSFHSRAHKFRVLAVYNDEVWMKCESCERDDVFFTIKQEYIILDSDKNDV